MQLVVSSNATFTLPEEDSASDEDVKGLGDEDCYDTDEAWPAEELPDEGYGYN